MSSDLRVGLIGAGVMGENYVRVIENAPGAAIAAVCDLELERAERLAGQCGAARAYASAEEMLAEEEVDAAVVATPDFAHRKPTLACLERGLAVLCEKPLAQTMADCQAIVEAQRAAGTPFMVNYGNRHRSNARRIRAIIAEGRIGRPQYAYVRLNERLCKTRELSWLERTSPTWFLLSHCTDLICWMLGERLEQVQARASFGAVEKLAPGGAVAGGSGPQAPPGVPDLVIASCVTDAGTLVNLESCWSLPDGYAQDIDFFVQIIGSKGVVQADLFAHDLWVHTPERSGVDNYAMGVEMPSGHLVAWWAESVRYFLHCVATGELPEPGAEEAMAVSQALLAIERSRASGEPVVVSEITD